MQKKSLGLAIFDFDGTIYGGETFRLFLRVLGRDPARRGRIRWYYLTHAAGYALYKLGFCRLRLMTYATRGLARILRGMDEDELQAYFGRCLAEAVSRFNPAVLARLRAHAAAGDRIVLLSGAFEVFLGLVAREIGAGAWLGTPLVMRDGRCTGRIGAHCIGPAKAAALRAYLAGLGRAGETYDLDRAYAYADSLHDLPILSLAGHAVAVNPDRGLLRKAQELGWEVLPPPEDQTCAKSGETGPCERC